MAHHLPFRFARRDNNMLITNEVGEFYFLGREGFDTFIKEPEKLNKDIFGDLLSKGFIYDSNLSHAIEQSAIKYRTKHKFLYDHASLHMFIVTLRCNQRCSYCHASSKSDSDDKSLDMSITTARKCVDFAFQTPTSRIKIELQGGEPLLNFETVEEIIEYSEECSNNYGKNVDYVVCTNLTNLEQKHIDFFKEYNVAISTSLDGPKEIHDANRKLRNGKGTYDTVVSNMERAINELGEGMVAALMTVTPANINKLKDVVDEYIERRLEYIFIRKLNMLGYAYDNNALYCDPEAFLKKYEEALRYIIRLNLKGIFFPETFSTILLSRILTPFSTGFMDLQSPTGAGICGLAYERNGDVFISDEARMLHMTTGDKYFCIGNVNSNTWKDAICSNRFRYIADRTCTDTIPKCSWCAYKPYCGSDPVKNYYLEKSLYGNHNKSEFCITISSLFSLLFRYIEEDDDDIMDVFWSWITNRRIAFVERCNDKEGSAKI